jgi:hypothetical protein
MKRRAFTTALLESSVIPFSFLVFSRYLWRARDFKKDVSPSRKRVVAAASMLYESIERLETPDRDSMPLVMAVEAA